MNVAASGRRPIWSDALTMSLASVIPPDRRVAALHVIKAIHTAAFAIIGGAILSFTWDGMRRRRDRRTGIAFAIAISESIVYASNNQVCPLTPLAEQLGADSGSITDLYLPRCVSVRVPLVGVALLSVGIACQLIARRGATSMVEVSLGRR